MKACTVLNVPIVIVSAALTDIVERSIDLLIEEIGSEGDKIDRNLVHIIANNSDFCPQTQKLKGFLDPLVHTTNKGDVVKHYFNTSKHAEELLKRHNIIVMGDLIDDIKMASHLHEVEDDLLSIGFFNNPQKDGMKLLHEYENNFDMVISDDGNL